LVRGYNRYALPWVCAQSKYVERTTGSIGGGILNQNSLDGKVAIVTGSGRGIGKAIAIGFARAGAKVVVCGRTAGHDAGPWSIDATLQQIEALGGEALAIQCDVAQSDQVDRVVDRTLQEWGRVDVLVNNAGYKWSKNLLDTPYATWDAIIRTNLDGVYLCSMAALKPMRKQRSGSIITISSGAATSTGPGSAAYAASKAGVDRLMIKLGAELIDEGISANALDPGATLTEENQLRDDKDRSTWVLTEEKKIIPACIFLAGQTPNGITGRVLNEAEFGISWP
jgi:3-oxoacyl-[acyl-carrier protein] reductase